MSNMQRESYHKRSLEVQSETKILKQCRHNSIAKYLGENMFTKRECGINNVSVGYIGAYNLILAQRIQFLGKIHSKGTNEF